MTSNQPDREQKSIFQKVLDQYFEQRDLTHLEKLIQAGIDLDCELENRETPLQQAVEKGDARLVEYLLAMGASPNGGSQEASLLRAAYNGLEDIYFLLLPTSDSNTRHKAEQIWQFIGLHRLRRREFVNPIIDNFVFNAALGAIEEVKAAIDLGVNINEVNSMGSPALILAIRNERSDVVKMLLEHGADPNLSADDPPWETPLVEACHNLNQPSAIKIVQYLLEYGANPNYIPDVVRKNPEFDITLSSLNPLVVSVRNGSIDAARLLIDAGAIISDDDKKALLDLISSPQQRESYEFLLG
jgi:ankyrin repeat protein